MVKSKKDSSFKWTDDEAELLLQVAVEYKTAKAMESIDCESVQKKYSDITDLYKAQLPKTDEDAEAIGKDYPHKAEEIKKGTIASNLKSIRVKYRQAVDSGRKSGHGRVVHIFFELCETLCGGSPAMVKINSGIETTDMEPPRGNTQEVSPSSPLNIVECADSTEVQNLPSTPICH